MEKTKWTFNTGTAEWKWFLEPCDGFLVVQCSCNLLVTCLKIPLRSKKKVKSPCCFLLLCSIWYISYQQLQEQNQCSIFCFWKTYVDQILKLIFSFFSILMELTVTFLFHHTNVFRILRILSICFIWQRASSLIYKDIFKNDLGTDGCTGR